MIGHLQCCDSLPFDVIPSLLWHPSFDVTSLMLWQHTFCCDFTIFLYIYCFMWNVNLNFCSCATCFFFPLGSMLIFMPSLLCCLLYEDSYIHMNCWGSPVHAKYNLSPCLYGCQWVKWLPRMSHILTILLPIRLLISITHIWFLHLLLITFFSKAQYLTYITFVTSVFFVRTTCLYCTNGGRKPSIKPSVPSSVKSDRNHFLLELFHR